MGARKPLSSEVSRKEVEKAMRQFIAKGGEVKVLSPEQLVSRKVVRGDQWEAYEPLENLAEE